MKGLGGSHITRQFDCFPRLPSVYLFICQPSNRTVEIPFTEIELIGSFIEKKRQF